MTSSMTEVLPHGLNGLEETGLVIPQVCSLLESSLPEAVRKRPE